MALLAKISLKWSIHASQSLAMASWRGDEELLWWVIGFAPCLTSSVMMAKAVVWASLLRSHRAAMITAWERGDSVVLFPPYGSAL